MVRAVHVIAFLSAAALLGCASEEIPRTQLMLVADTDIAQLDHIEFVVSERTRELRSDRLAVDVADAPFTMAVLREQGSLGPLIVSAIGYHGDAMLVERSALVSFVPGETLTVVLHLVQSCMDMPCPAGRTCTEHGCQAPDDDALKPWNGTPPRLDDQDAGTLAMDAGPDLDGTSTDGEAPDAAGTDEDGGALDAGTDEGGSAPDAAGTDGDGSAPDGAGPTEDGSAPDAGDASWMQCNSSSVDVNSSIDHCGRCNRPCPTTGNGRDNLVAVCTDGQCGVVCRSLWGDCDGDEGNGCENWLAYDVENCGGCGLTCRDEEYCWSGECIVRQN